MEAGIFLDNRIEIENPGILLPGLTIEDIKQGMSKIRNQVIARTFRELDLIEQWGTGVRKIFQEAKRLRLPEPEITEIGMRVRMTIYLAKTFTVLTAKQPDTDKAHDLSATEKRILQAYRNNPLSTPKLLDALGYKSRTGYFKKALSRHSVLAYWKEPSLMLHGVKNKKYKLNI